MKEVTLHRLGKKLGLYRAAPTRFAGFVREMGRMLRLKADLKYIVDLHEYAAQDFRKKKAADGTAEDPDDLDGEGGVRMIVLDEEGFWKPLVEALKLLTPIVKVLRMCDGEVPAMGKLYDRMFLLVQKASQSQISWAPLAKEKIETRWEYLHSYMHGAGYPLDPEFIDFKKTDNGEEEEKSTWDEAVQNGVTEIVERLCLRECMLENKEKHDNPVEALTVQSPVVIEKVAACELELSKFKSRDGVFTRGSVIANAKVMAPAVWWDMYGSHLPVLSRIAKVVLAQVISASAAERNWSIYGQIKSIKRQSLKHAVADKLVYCPEAIHLREKLQKAGYEGKVEKWVSDSDTDASSDDEEDLAV